MRVIKKLASINDVNENGWTFARPFCFCPIRKGKGADTDCFTSASQQSSRSGTIPSSMQNAPASARSRFHSVLEITLQRVFLYSEYQFGYGIIESHTRRRH
jgi:hypothetical protein